MTSVMRFGTMFSSETENDVGFLQNFIKEVFWL